MWIASHSQTRFTACVAFHFQWPPAVHHPAFCKRTFQLVEQTCTVPSAASCHLDHHGNNQIHNQLQLNILQSMCDGLSSQKEDRPSPNAPSLRVEGVRSSVTFDETKRSKVKQKVGDHCLQISKETCECKCSWCAMPPVGQNLSWCIVHIFLIVWLLVLWSISDVSGLQPRLHVGNSEWRTFCEGSLGSPRMWSVWRAAGEPPAPWQRDVSPLPPPPPAKGANSWVTAVSAPPLTCSVRFIQADLGDAAGVTPRSAPLQHAVLVQRVRWCHAERKSRTREPKAKPPPPKVTSIKWGARFKVTGLLQLQLLDPDKQQCWGNPLRAQHHAAFKCCW